MRLNLTTLILTIMLAGGLAARADDLAAFEAVAELPSAQVVCLGEAALPEMLRFAFQPEPATGEVPQVIRVADTRRTSRAGPGARPGAASSARPSMRQAGVPVLRLPCIRG